jgi:hypothetical protein
MSDSKIAVVQSTGKREEHSEEMELPTVEEFAQLLRDDTLTCSSANSTNYQRYTRGSYSRLAR